jgi:enoyl-CoA hydratase
MGGGVGLSAYASLRLATEHSRIAMPETKIGFAPDVGALYLLSRAPGELGTHLALTGTTIDGPDAVAVGLADTVVPSAVVPHLLRSLTEGADTLDLGPAAEPSRLVAQRGWIDECFAGDDPAGVLERLQASAQPEARKAAEVLGQRSPLSVAVALEATRRARAMGSLREVLDQDLVVGTNLARRGDLVEGVRALLVDRDNAPRWKHGSISDVSRAEVLSMFEA